MTNDKIIVIIGPTASGKSELAVKFAKKMNGEVISADSRQVYKGLDIGSGKVLGKWKNLPVSKSSICKNLTLKKRIKEKKIYIYKNIPHYCLDVASPKRIFTAVDFKKCAEKAIEDILARGKTPIICGGTGFYISAITGGIDIPEVKPNWKLRKKLEKMSVEKLFKMLKKLNPERAKNIDAKNPRRLIRAIEIALLLKTKKQKGRKTMRSLVYRTIFLGIKTTEKELKKRIEKRVKKMLKDGLINEVKKLRKSGLSWERLYGLGFEYKYPAMLLQSKITKKEMLEKMILENWHYAKRQMTWFKKYMPKTKWLALNKIKKKLAQTFKMDHFLSCQ